MSDYPTARSPESMPLLDFCGEVGELGDLVQDPSAKADFDGATYDPNQDKQRLETTLGRVYLFMSDGCWHTIAEVARAAKCSESGASARIRDLRKPKFRARYPNGGIELERVEGGSGLYQYRMICERVV